MVMKNLILSFGLLFSLFVQAQERTIPDKDDVPNCKLMTSGKFINMETDDRVTSGYYIIIKDGIETEYAEDGKYFVKSSLVFDTDCTYRAITIESDIPNFPSKKGDVLNSEILETSTKHNLIKMRAKEGNGPWLIVVLRKVE